MLRTRGVGGVGWDVNVHVNLQKRLMLRTPGLGQYICIYIFNIFTDSFGTFIHIQQFLIDVYIYIY